MLIETDRLIIRRLKNSDYEDVKAMLQSPDVMYAYEGPMSETECRRWMNRQLERYSVKNMGLNAVILKESGDLIGQAGLTLQDAGGFEVTELGYLLKSGFWHCGYAAEAAAALRDYAFSSLGLDEVYSIIRDTNTASMHAAKRCGMEKRGEIIKHFRGIDMLHYVFSVRNPLKNK